MVSKDKQRKGIICDSMRQVPFFKPEFNKIGYFCTKEIKIMKHISLASIEKAIKKVDNLDEDGLERIAETYAVDVSLWWD